MNKCKEYTDKQLQDYFLNRLEREETEAFQFHLLHCEKCRVKLEQIRCLSAGMTTDVPLVSNTGKPDGRSFRLPFSLFTRVAAIAGLLLLLAGGSYYFMYKPSEKDIPLEINEPPVLHSADSVTADSTNIQRIEEDIHVE